jgi:hypothetical protein
MTSDVEIVVESMKWGGEWGVRVVRTIEAIKMRLRLSSTT